MGFDTHILKVDGNVRTFHTCNDFWECNCKTSYFHTYKESSCEKCGAQNDECPDATVEEMLAILNAPRQKEN